MKHVLYITLVVLAPLVGNAQKFMTQSGGVRFFSETPIENIEAVNRQVSAVLDTETGNMAFTMLMRAFTFEKALMQEHFNEKYVESDKYPKAQFKGAVVDFDASRLGTEPLPVKVVGMMTMHGVTREVVADGVMQRNSDTAIGAQSTFAIKPEDFKIKIPSAVRDNIAREIEVTVNVVYEKID